MADMEAPSIGGKKMPKWVIWGLVIIAVIGVVILVLGKRSSVSTPTGAAAPSGAMQTATTGQDLSTLNNNAANEWSSLMTQLNSLNANSADYATSISTLTDVTGQQANKINQLGDSLTSTQQTVSSLSQNLSTLGVNVNNLTGSQSQLQSELDSINGKVGSGNSNLQEMARSINALQTQIVANSNHTSNTAALDILNRQGARPTIVQNGQLTLGAPGTYA